MASSSKSSSGSSGGRKKKTPQGVQGMHDLLPKEGQWWQMLMRAGDMVGEIFNLNFIDTPVIEHAALFDAAFGKDSKECRPEELYTFKIPGTRAQVALRPDIASTVVRSYLEHHLGYFASPLRLQYMGPVFRRTGKETPSRSHRWGAMVIGDNDPIYDAEMIMATLKFLDLVKIRDAVVHINAPGCKVCRPTFENKLRAYYKQRDAKPCDNCKDSGDPLGVMRCELDRCPERVEEAPVMMNFLCQSCNAHFQRVLEHIEDNEVNYLPDPYLVGDLGYCSKVQFVVRSADDKHVLATGGRQDYLAERISGRQLPVTSTALYLDNIIEHLKESKVDPKTSTRRTVFFIAVGEEARKASLTLMNQLRQSGIVVVESLGRKTLRSQLKVAEKSGLPLTLIYGQKEVYDGSVILRSLESGTQESVLVDAMIEQVKKRL